MDTDGSYRSQKGNAFIGLLLIFGVLVAGIWYFNSDFSIYRKAESKSLSGRPQTHVIQITDSGFIPPRLAAKPGDTVKFVNMDGREHHPYSDPESSYGFCQGLDSIRPLKINETFSGIFEKETICTYYDKLDDSLEGRIVINNP